MEDNRKRLKGKDAADAVVKDYLFRKNSKKYIKNHCRKGLDVHSAIKGINMYEPNEMQKLHIETVRRKFNELENQISDSLDALTEKIEQPKGMEVKRDAYTAAPAITDDDRLCIDFAKTFFGNWTDNEEIFRIIDEYDLDFYLGMAIAMIAHSKGCTIYYRAKILDSVVELINHWMDFALSNHTVSCVDPFTDATKIITDDSSEIVAAVALILTGATTGDTDKAKLYIEAANTIIYDAYHVKDTWQ